MAKALPKDTWKLVSIMIGTNDLNLHCHRISSFSFPLFFSPVIFPFLSLPLAKMVSLFAFFVADIIRSVFLPSPVSWELPSFVLINFLVTVEEQVQSFVANIRGVLDILHRDLPRTLVAISAPFRLLLLLLLFLLLLLLLQIVFLLLLLPLLLDLALVSLSSFSVFL